MKAGQKGLSFGARPQIFIGKNMIFHRKVPAWQRGLNFG